LKKYVKIISDGKWGDKWEDDLEKKLRFFYNNFYLAVVQGFDWVEEEVATETEVTDTATIPFYNTEVKLLILAAGTGLFVGAYWLFHRKEGLPQTAYQKILEN